MIQSEIPAVAGQSQNTAFQLFDGRLRGDVVLTPGQETWGQVDQWKEDAGLQNWANVARTAPARGTRAAHPCRDSENPLWQRPVLHTAN